MITKEIKKATKSLVKEYLKKLNAEEIKVNIIWNKRFISKMGDALYYPGKLEGRIRLSSKLWVRATEVQRSETVIHELCHIVNAHRAHKNGRPRPASHGREWKLLMHSCGVHPKRTHCVDNKDLVAHRRVKAPCKCEPDRMVTKYVAGRIAAGARYRCKKCYECVTVPDGVVPVAKRVRRRKSHRLAAMAG